MPLDTLVARTTSLSWFSVGLKRFLAPLLAGSLTLFAQQAVTLKIRPLDALQLQQSFTSAGSNKTIIVVEDSSGAPIGGAAVSFRLPDEDPTGTFANGLRSEIAVTGPDGRATLAPIHWAGQPGTIPLRVTAAKGTLRAGVVLNLELSAHQAPAAPTPTPPAVVQTTPPPLGPPIVRGASIAVAPKTNAELPPDLQIPKYDPPSFWKSKWFLIIVAGGGAVAAGYAATKWKTSSNALVPGTFTPGSITQVPVTIGPPTITIGKP